MTPDQREMLETRLQRSARVVLERPWVAVRSALHLARTSTRDAPRDAVEIEFDGQRVRGCPSDNYLLGGLYRKGTWELLVTERFKECVTPGMCVIDIGADVGYYTLLAAKRVGPAGRVVAFEPVASAADLLRENIALNGYTNTAVSPVALFSASRRMQLAEGDATSLTTGLRDARNDSGITCEPLDLLFDSLDLTRLDLVKMDIEGAEIDALLGMEGLLKRFKPQLIIEVHPKKFHHFDRTAQDLLDLLTRLDYRWEPLDVYGHPLQQAARGRRRRNFHIHCY